MRGLDVQRADNLSVALTVMSVFVLQADASHCRYDERTIWSDTASTTSAFTSYISFEDLQQAISKYRSSRCSEAYYLLTGPYFFNGFMWRLKLTVKPPDEDSPHDMNIHVGLCWGIEVCLFVHFMQKSLRVDIACVIQLIRMFCKDYIVFGCLVFNQLWGFQGLCWSLVGQCMLNDLLMLFINMRLMTLLQVEGEGPVSLGDKASVVVDFDIATWDFIMEEEDPTSSDGQVSLMGGGNDEGGGGFTIILMH